MSREGKKGPKNANKKNATIYSPPYIIDSIKIDFTKVFCSPRGSKSKTSSRIIDIAKLIGKIIVRKKIDSVTNQSMKEVIKGSSIINLEITDMRKTMDQKTVFRLIKFLDIPNDMV